MKKLFFLIFSIFYFIHVNAQNYQISFAGTGASTSIDSVKVENLTQCTDTILGGGDILHLIATIGINELNTSSENALHIYPNPMTGTCSVDFEATDQGKTTFEIYDISGNRILQVQELLILGHHTFSLSGIGSGIYMLKVESDKYSYTAKIVSSNLSKGIAEIKHIETIQGIGEQSKASNGGKMQSLKSDKSVIDMQYTLGDILKFTGISSIYRTIFMLVPTQNLIVTFNFVACTDADSNHYTVITIGAQTWMAENLKTTKYRNGDQIPNVVNNIQWGNLTTGAYCDYDNFTGNSATYGRLYNWFVVNENRNLCPTGWHVPTDTEWTTLTTYLGGESIAGGKLKDICTTDWLSPNTGATNETGFTALPAGNRYFNGAFYRFGYNGYWWSATEYDTSYALYRSLDCYFSYIGRSYFQKNYGFSVRCLMD